MCDEERMTAQNYWDERYRGRKAIRYGVTRQIIEPALYRRLKSLFEKWLPQGKGKKVLEMGCAPGGWLVYFHRLGYDVYGVDYSQAGCELTRETLRNNGVKGVITCEDVFNASFLNKYEGFFDVVYSLGVVEHFADPADIISIHLKLLHTGGFLIVGMPNYGDGTLLRKLEKIAGGEEDLVKTHNVRVMKLPEFRKYLEPFENIQIQMLDYIGPIGLPLKSRYVGFALNYVVGYLTFFLNSEVLSSYIVLIARKR